MAVFDTMRYVKSDVSTVCVGLAASMGAFILASGHKVCSCPLQLPASGVSLVISNVMLCRFLYQLLWCCSVAHAALSVSRPHALQL